LNDRGNNAAYLAARIHHGEDIKLSLRAKAGAPEGNQNAKKDKGENNCDNITIEYERGTSRAYTLKPPDNVRTFSNTGGNSSAYLAAISYPSAGQSKL
jgi:hypothetical protein